MSDKQGIGSSRDRSIGGEYRAPSDDAGRLSSTMTFSDLLNSLSDESVPLDIAFDRAWDHLHRMVPPADQDTYAVRITG